MHPHPLSFQRQAGNALFLILIAVALFAALSYAVTQSGRGGGGIGKEQAQLTAAEVAMFFGTIQQAVSRLRLMGCADNQITPEGAGYRAGPGLGGGVMLPQGSNPNAPSDKSCHIFNPAGGGVSPQIIQNAAHPNVLSYDPGNTSWARPVHPWFIVRNVPGAGTSEPDLVVTLPHVSDEVCRAYNKAVGIGGAAGNPLGPVNTMCEQFQGDWTDGFGCDNEIPSAITACTQTDCCDGLNIYMTIMER